MTYMLAPRHLPQNTVLFFFSICLRRHWQLTVLAKYVEHEVRALINKYAKITKGTDIISCSRSCPLLSSHRVEQPSRCDMNGTRWCYPSEFSASLKANDADLPVTVTSFFVRCS